MATHIMVVDDTKEILDLFEEILTEAGYKVSSYSYGVQELAEIKRIAPDLLILDYLIGDEKLGWQLLQKMKMDKELAHIPIIICSAAIRQLYEMQGWLTEKNVGIVFKPFDIDDLLLAVKKAIEANAPGRGSKGR